MQVIRGVLQLVDGPPVDMPAGAIVSNGWGTIGSVEIRGAPGPKAWPKRLEIKWFSYSENRFYAIDTPLPPEALGAALSTGYSNPRNGAAGEFNIVLLGLAPGGTVSLWLAGDGIVRRVGRWQGAPVDGRWSDILDDDRTPRDQFVRDVMTRRTTSDAMLRHAKEGAPVDAWIQADERVPMQLSVVGVPTVRFAWYHAINGEHEYLDTAQVWLTNSPLRAAPDGLEVGWQAANGQRRRAVLQLDEAETRAALDQLRKDSGTSNYQVVVDLAVTSATGATPEVSMRSARLRIALQKVTAKITGG